VPPKDREGAAPRWGELRAGLGDPVGEYTVVEGGCRGDAGVGENAVLFTTVPRLERVWGRVLCRGWRGRRTPRQGWKGTASLVGCGGECCARDRDEGASG